VRMPEERSAGAGGQAHEPAGRSCASLKRASPKRRTYCAVSGTTPTSDERLKFRRPYRRSLWPTLCLAPFAQAHPGPELLVRVNEDQAGLLQGPADLGGCLKAKIAVAGLELLQRPVGHAGLLGQSLARPADHSSCAPELRRRQ